MERGYTIAADWMVEVPKQSDHVFVVSDVIEMEFETGGVGDEGAGLAETVLFHTD